MFIIVKAFKIKNPSSSMVVGPFGCAKTKLVEDLPCSHINIFDRKPDSFHYYYGA